MTNGGQQYGSWIQRRREELRLSVRDAAAKLGFSSSTLSAIESGKIPLAFVRSNPDYYLALENLFGHYEEESERQASATYRRTPKGGVAEVDEDIDEFLRSLVQGNGEIKKTYFRQLPSRDGFQARRNSDSRKRIFIDNICFKCQTPICSIDDYCPNPDCRAPVDNSH